LQSKNKLGTAALVEPVAFRKGIDPPEASNPFSIDGTL
jgi:hypothetical protein